MIIFSVSISPFTPHWVISYLYPAKNGLFFEGRVWRILVPSTSISYSDLEPALESKPMRSDWLLSQAKYIPGISSRNSWEKSVTPNCRWVFPQMTGNWFVTRSCYVEWNVLPIDGATKCFAAGASEPPSGPPRHLESGDLLRIPCPPECYLSKELLNTRHSLLDGRPRNHSCQVVNGLLQLKPLPDTFKSSSFLPSKGEVILRTKN